MIPLKSSVMSWHSHRRSSFLLVLVLLLCSQAFGEALRERMGFHVYFAGTDDYITDNAADFFSAAFEVGDWTVVGVGWWDVAGDYPGGPLDFTNVEAKFTVAQAIGLNVIMQVFTVPPFARPAPFDMDGSPASSYIALKDTDVAKNQWADFCRTVIERYYPDVTHFEIGNEPNTNRYYQRFFTDDRGWPTAKIPGIVEYPEYLKIAYDSMHEQAALYQQSNPGSPPLTVLSGGMVPRRWTVTQDTSLYSPPDTTAYTPDQFLKHMYAYSHSIGDSTLFDAVGYHPYGPFGVGKGTAAVHDSLELLALGSTISYEQLRADPRVIVADPSRLTGISPMSSFMHTQELYAIMCEEGESSKKIWGTECGPAIDTTWSRVETFCAIDSLTGDTVCWDSTVVYETHGLNSEELQAFWAQAYLEQWRQWEFAGPLMWWNVREQLGNDPDHVGWGAMHPDGTPKPAYTKWLQLSQLKSEVHVGIGEEFDFENLDDAIDYIHENSDWFDSWRIYLYENPNEYFFGGWAFTDVDSISIQGVTGTPEAFEPAEEGAVRLSCMSLHGPMEFRECDAEIRDVTFEDCSSNNVLMKAQDASLDLYNTVFRNGYSSGSPFLWVQNSDLLAENCSFIENYSWRGAQSGMPEYGLVYLTNGSKATVTNSLFLENLGGTASAIISGLDVNVDWLSSATITNCTFHHDRGITQPSDAATMSFHQNAAVEITNCLFTNSHDPESTNAGLCESIAGTAGPNLTVKHSLFDQSIWWLTDGYAFIDTSQTGKNLVLPISASADFVKYTPDYALRHDSQCLDKGDPQIVDFDLTTSDIGYTPQYAVKQLQLTVDCLEPGWYEVEGAAAVIQTDIPAGTSIRVAAGKTLIIQGGDDLSIGDVAGQRTAIVGREAPDGSPANAIIVGVTTDKAGALQGVLFNYPANYAGTRPWLQFGSLTGLDLRPELVSFHNYGEAELYFMHCEGEFSGYDIRYKEGVPPRFFQDFPTPKQLTLYSTELRVKDCTFGIPNFQDASWSVKVEGTPVGGIPLLEDNTFLFQGQDADSLLPPVLVRQGVAELRGNQFVDCVVPALSQETNSTVHMNEGAMNRFIGYDHTEDGLTQSLVRMVGDCYLDLHCGYNSFVSPQFGGLNIDLVSYTSSSPPLNTRTWRKNFWGESCTDSIPTSAITPADTSEWAIPFWAELEYNLGSCPILYPDTCPYDEMTALVTLKAGKDAEYLGDLATAQGHYRAVVLSYTKDPEANEASLKLKALGLDKAYGELNFSALQTDLFQASDSSLALGVIHQAMLQECSGWCVEARWQRRTEILSLLDSMQMAETDPINYNTIKLAKLEIQAYPPPPGGMSAAGTASFAPSRILEESEAAHEFLHYEMVQTIPGDLEEEPGLPTQFRIANVYPNPFNPSTTIILELPKEGKASVLVYNLLGQKVMTLLEEELEAGSHTLAFDGSAFASGVYIVTARSEFGVQHRKMLLLK